MINREFDPLLFAAYIRHRWRAVAIACGVAVSLAFGISEVVPRRYSATARILIQPPGANDPRAATQVSPVYLESLKSYERFASSDTLFVRAINVIQGAGEDAGAPVESLKRKVLTISKLPSTAILEIGVTLRSAKKAQALAQYIAEQTVALSRSLDARSSEEMTKEFNAQLAAARARHDHARRALEEFALRQPVHTLENDVQDAQFLKFRVEQDLEAARGDLADYTARRPHDLEEEEWLQNYVASTRARADELARRARELTDSLARKGPELEAGKLREDVLEAEEKSAAAGVDTATTRLNEALSTVPFRGERLEIIDPGIVSHQPSSPNTVLNVLAALLLSVVGSIVWLAFSFGRSRHLSSPRELAYSHTLR